MSCGLSGRYYSATIFATQCDDYERDATASDSDDLNSLLAILEPRVDFFQTVRVFEGSNRIRKIHAMLAKVFSGYAIVPFILHTGYGYRIPVVPASHCGDLREMGSDLDWRGNGAIGHSSAGWRRSLNPPSLQV
jgi:hypothetical protein